MAWLKLTICDITKPGKNDLTLVDPDHVSDFFAASERDREDTLHTFTVVVFAPGGGQRAVRVKETIEQIEETLRGLHKASLPVMMPPPPLMSM